jgi:hypothetical protein
VAPTPATSAHLSCTLSDAHHSMSLALQHPPHMFHEPLQGEGDFWDEAHIHNTLGVEQERAQEGQ